ncbi:MAG: alpha/beta hydrolase [Kiloniellaceae bacterium]
MTEPSLSRENFLLDIPLDGAGLRLAARRLRPPGAAGAAPSLVFLHEALGSIGQWKGFPEDLAAASRRPALVYERQGHGRSSPLPLPRDSEYLRREAEVVLPAVLSASGVERPVLIGHSDGATIALLYAAAFPERTAGCVALAPHVMIEDMTLDGIRAADQEPGAAEIRRRLARYHGNQTETLWRAWTETWLRPGFAGCEMRRDLARITAPCLVIQGADDAYGSERQVGLIMERVSGPADSLLLPACGHQPHLEQRTAVLAAVTAFLAGPGMPGA